MLASHALLLQVNGRVLPPPRLRYGGGVNINPGDKGDWDLRSIKYVFYSRHGLQSREDCSAGAVRPAVAHCCSVRMGAGLASSTESCEVARPPQLE